MSLRDSVLMHILIIGGIFFAVGLFISVLWWRHPLKDIDWPMWNLVLYVTAVWFMVSGALSTIAMVLLMKPEKTE
jgi:cytochrome c oxidase assembly factor CtaG